ncbi:hypothetical protein ACTAZI_14915 [Legionella bozemanae]|uniref:hypothetical protein n=1 Tax=Legionella bozemanae TaxID=447 RepID=UPI003EEB0421
MKKLIISVVLSIPFFLTAWPAFAAFPLALENPALRTDVSSANNNLSKVANYAYWHHGHRWHHWNRWHWHRWHHWHYY